MNFRDNSVAERFLQKVHEDYGEEVRKVCEDLINALPGECEFDSFQILNQARRQLQEPHLEELAAMNASPFNSPRD